MNKWICGLAIALAAGAVQAHEGAHGGHAQAPAQGPTPVAAGKGGAYYGTIMPTGEPVMISKAAAQPEQHSAAPQAFQGRITEVCQKQGCWMVLEDGGSFARVFMSGHSFSVPKDARSTAVVYGKLSVKKLDEKEMQHLASEGSKPQPQELQIDASSVWIAGG